MAPPVHSPARTDGPNRGILEASASGRKQSGKDLRCGGDRRRGDGLHHSPSSGARPHGRRSSRSLRAVHGGLGTQHRNIHPHVSRSPSHSLHPKGDGAVADGRQLAGPRCRLPAEGRTRGGADRGRGTCIRDRDEAPQGGRGADRDYRRQSRPGNRTGAF